MTTLWPSMSVFARIARIIIAMTARQCLNASATRPKKDAIQRIAMDAAVFTNAIYAKEYGAMLVSVKIISSSIAAGAKNTGKINYPTTNLPNTRRDAANRCAKTA